MYKLSCLYGFKDSSQWVIEEASWSQTKRESTEERASGKPRHGQTAKAQAVPTVDTTGMHRSSWTSAERCSWHVGCSRQDNRHRQEVLLKFSFWYLHQLIEGCSCWCAERGQQGVKATVPAPRLFFLLVVVLQKKEPIDPFLLYLICG